MSVELLNGGYRKMWLIVMFDLPTEEPYQRKAYTKFRQFLLDDGFNMMQYSVYFRFCGTHNQMNTHINRVKNNLPIDGEVRILNFTDKQFSSIKIFYSMRQQKNEIYLPQYIFV